MLRTMGWVALGALVASAGSSRAQAQSNKEVFEERREVASPERFTWEVLRVGPYTPNVSAFRESFEGDKGLMWASELDGIILRIPFVGTLGAGVSAGWASYSGRAFGADGTTRVDERTKLRLFPIAALGVLRIDVLARELNIPLVFSGKLGGDFVIWTSSTGEQSDGTGVSIGLRWAGQVALELDFLDRAAARALDADWGINHSFLFFELYGSTASTSLPVADVTWAAGLGFVL